MLGALRYRIADITKLYLTIHQAEKTVALIAESIVSEYVITHTLNDCTAIKLMENVTAELDLSPHGLEGVDFRLTDFAVVKTYRLIGGDLVRYTGDELSTNNHYEVG